MDSEFDPMSLVETALESSDKPESESCAEGKEGEAKKSLLETALESSDKPESFVEGKKEEAKKSVDSKKNGHVEEPETICLSSDEELDTDKRTKVILSRLPKSLTVIRGRTDDVTVLEEKLTTKTKRSLEHKQESSKSELEIDDPEEWDDLILMLRKSLKEDLDLKILDALVKRYQKLRSHLVASVRFLEVLRRTAKEVEEERDVNKVINHIGGLVENMKSIVKETKHYSGTVHCSDSKASMMASNISSSPATWIPAEEIRRSLAVANRKKKIQTLETALEKIQHELKKMDDAEVDFDDETNSTFLMSGRLEAKAAKIYKKLCELNGAVSDCGRPTLIKYKCKGK
ncbi:unnamed protein product [Cyprideis torosa]|uniref:Uncharacterized protein n=1 Tax=Cyprideis torosa TaxID=163714 RepID=A0A7R8ZMV0_9CRUS|nr:unnamed protein product [Cyprideis torosa]CAG0886429.1 unnamed protein product [Cyprideis torosa]